MKTIYSLMFTVAVTFLAIFSFSNVSFAAGESQYDLIDGKQVSTNANDPKVKHIYYTGDEQGNEVRLGFTTQQKVDDYIKNEKKVEKESIVSSNFETLGSGTCCTDFYTGDNKSGSYRALRVGYAISDITYSWGRSWNDVISSISTASQGTTYLYQHEYSSGGYIRFNNAYYWGKTINLSKYKFSNGVSANNNASSVYVLD
ncbi:hypothetical protein [Peribacillus butanolivorans]|uniref:Uncharacterized protein n=1 Tax=Peribacillus butanolivorans TaxID=421767 RepID=A0ABN5NCH2_9BACI|nr:hypothetical protein [Peribacillus butanolivorans]AXN40891.1 hypothetical protein DTO10_22610 [Peribacillus butanolivorans]QNU05252.1 hypothetical protein GM240_15880 [Peribacillus butanolivorans]